jgi:hypothetical protein
MQMREGFGFISSMLMRLPATPGGDVAGEVLEADPGSKFKPGADDCSQAFKAGWFVSSTPHPGQPASVLGSCPVAAQATESWA